LTRVYKILSRTEWNDALSKGAFEGSAIDRADGFIHLSAADQAVETARRWFHGREDLVVLSLDTNDLGPELKWEPSRGDALFPHFYGRLACDKVVDVRPAPLDGDGLPQLGFLAP
jgi:uncharacterized protein (DUF952 family)